jgi:hypothetical protein
VKKRSLVLLTIFAALMLALLGYPALANDNTGPHISRMAHLANRQNDSNTTHSDLAFWGNLMAQGTYEGFRLFNISNPSSPKLIVDFLCTAGTPNSSSQGDVSLHKADDRLLLFRSIDNPMTSARCDAIASPDENTNPDYFEGVQIFDVTNPSRPRFIKGVYTDCGSHTHTTIRDTKNDRAIIYISSYPLGGPTQDPDGADTKHEGCVQPHEKIGIVVVPNGNLARARLHHYQDIEAPSVLAGTPADDLADPGTIGCHDITAFTHSKVRTAAAACLTEGQLWDISNPLFPCTTDDSCHTHIDNLSVEIWHSAAFTWDARVVLFGDEHGGGSAPGCGGQTDTTGNVWFYRYVEPGTATTPVLGRYHIPRPQPTAESCTMHNFNLIPIDDSRRYIAVSAAYEGGTTVFDFTSVKTATSPIIAEEVAYADRDANTDGNGADNIWSSYWYNNFIYASGGFSSMQRGLDVYKFLRQSGAQFTALKFGHHNPQTQERLILPSTGGGGGNGDNGDDD